MELLKERPILCRDWEVRAILDGRKTQTRRVFKVTDPCGNKWPVTSPEESIERFDDGTFHYLSTGGMSGPYPCPFGVPGDRLWVRETWCGVIDPNTSALKWNPDGNTYEVEYRATNERKIEYREHPDGGIDWRKDGTAKSPWSPSIHMPRWASRITLEVTGVRVERLHEITDADAILEGVGPFANSQTIDCETESPRRVFSGLWDSINGKTYPWSSNPWVWVVEFRRV